MIMIILIEGNIHPQKIFTTPETLILMTESTCRKPPLH